MLPIVIDKLGHSGCCGFIMQLKHRLFFPLTGQSSGPLCSLRTNSSVMQMSSYVLDEYTIDGELIVLVLHSSNWEWLLTEHDSSAVAFLIC